VKYPQSGNFMRISSVICASLLLAFIWIAPAKAQLQVGVPVTPVGQCQLSATQLASPVALASCLGASFTATCVGTTLTASSVTGAIKPGEVLAGTGIVAGTTVSANGTGTGGAGTYTTSQACTSSGASLTASGIPQGANALSMQAEVASVRWRDDGGAPSAAIGGLIVSGLNPYFYNGQLSALQFMAASGSPLLDVQFYKVSSP
jgi:hypothetical protein